jgi:hypothetical protein
MARRDRFHFERLPWLVHDYGASWQRAASRHHERGAYRWSVDDRLRRSAHAPQRHRRALTRRLRTASKTAPGHAGITQPNQPASGNEALGFTPVGVYRSGHKPGAFTTGWWLALPLASGRRSRSA